MPLEATMMIIDNSEYMRNGDYQPTRFQAQSDAVNTVFQTKIDSNPENTVGIMTMAGKAPEVLVTHSKELGHILKALHASSSKIGGSCDITTAIAVAQLALKHRENKNLRQRIIVFVGSPLSDAPTLSNGESSTDEKNMVKLAKKLKKNNVAVDIVSFGDGIEEGEKSVLKSFVESASSGDNSHIISVPPGSHLISDALLSSSILSADRNIPDEAMGDVSAGPSGSGGAGGANDFEFGVDPSLDPELAMALRMSMQEAQAREAAATAAAGGNTSSSAPTAAAGAGAAVTAATSAPDTMMADDEDDEDLQRAIAMSTGGEQGEDDVQMEDDDDEEEDDDDDEEEDEEAAIARAIEMSIKGEEAEKEQKK